MLLIFMKSSGVRMQDCFTVVMELQEEEQQVQLLYWMGEYLMANGEYPAPSETMSAFVKAKEKTLAPRRDSSIPKMAV